MSHLSHPTFLANLSTLWHLYQMRTWGVVIILAASAPAALAQGFAPGFQTLPHAAGTSVSIYGIAADGLTVCGRVSAGQVSTGFTYLQGEFSYVPNEHPDAIGSALTGVADGGVRAVGGVYTALPNYQTHALVVEQSGSQHVFVDPLGFSLSFRQISRDGSVAVGTRNFVEPIGVTRTQTVIYTPAGGVQYLPYISNYGGTYTEPNGLSADGHVICGGAQQFLFNDRVAWTWTQEGGYQMLPNVAGASVDYEATAANDDGSVIVGNGSGVGLRWVNGVVQTLPAAPGFRHGYPIDVSGDGSIITGIMRTIDTNRPVQGIWTEATGWVPFTTYLQSHGIDYPPGFLFTSNALYVSSDGMTFAGTSTEAFVIRIPTPSAGLLVAAIGFTRIRRRSGSPQKVLH